MKKQFTAETAQEAKELAAKEFGVSIDKITFNVIDEGSKGFLGIGKTNAVVEAEYEPSKSETAVAYLDSVLKAMDITAQYEVIENEDGVVIDISGDTTGAVIGRRGETLDALQYLTSMAANRSDKDYYRVNLDSCGYREKRKKILEDLAAKISKNVLRSGRSITLEPMNPYERRIIHATVSEIEGVTSKSVGDEPYRKVVISSVSGKGERRFDKRDRFKDRGRDDRRERRREPRSMDLFKTSFEKDYKKPKPEDSMISGDLYGKIDI
ncbi:MAG: protein jag [Oscillospiraceae bacterium]|nr:protein jag [Oscillospiraceae bacterium]